ncbi:putative metal-dependent hydrolase (beta-lactamase superfamily) [Trachipleistophora hominis]|uniref:ribonuclease Z n=1 Tax=Trachipleistophora hominis TaxID=72359 RepID=L7JSY5_TRAHO|nr:putative metal-dependent hydrolase (beta-lactamase superfamily) [Trachipleistophora hominis]
MSFSLEFLSTRSGKALLLKQETKHYLFGYYEGFQRHSIERNIRLPKITNVYLFEDHQVIPLLGFCLTVADMGREALWVYGTEKVKKIFQNACSFARRSKLKMTFSNNNTEVIPIETSNGMNYVIQLPKIKGRLDIDKLDRDFPVKLRKDLKDRKKVLFNGIEYDGNNYMEEDTEIGDICILYTITNEEECLAQLKQFNIKLFVCMNRDCLVLKKHYENGHFVLFEENNEIEYKSFFELQKKLNKIDANFLLPKKSVTKIDAVSAENASNGDRKMIYGLTDSHNINFTKKQPFVFHEDEKWIEQIIFLGTGSAIPSKYRNVSSIIYEEDNCAYLLDCGEDTLSQIDRVYGDLRILEKLKLIFISHSHADHHLGLYFVLKKIQHKVVVLCPQKVKNFLNLFDLDATFFVTDKNKKAEITYLSFNLNDKAIKVSICPVDHIGDSYGIKLQAAHSIAYSGDCRPSFMFAEMAKKSRCNDTRGHIYG